MGAKGMAAGTIALGVIIGVATIFFPPAGAGFAYYVAAVAAAGGMIAGGVIGLTMGAQNLSSQDNRAKDFSTSSAGEGFPIPVVFGEQKITGNWLCYSKDKFRSVEVPGESGIGGKGGGPAASSTIGYEYFLSFEYGICMGPIDAVAQVISSPGEKVMMGANPSPVTFAGDTSEVTLDEIDPQNPQGRQGGLIRIYVGNATQTRINPGGTDAYYANGMNYRNICWALFMDFKLGRIPQPRTYQFIIRRLPKCLRDDGTTVSGILTRGSNSTVHPNYIQANPAAMLYEALTNKLWGRGRASAIFNEQSFIDCSTYFAGKNIGIGWTLDAPEKLSAFVEMIKQHTRSILVWDADQIKMICLMDPAQARSHIQTLTEDDLDDLEVRRPFWQNTYNEVNLEFSNSKKNYRPDVVHIPELANQQINGKLDPYRVTLRGFTDWNTARRQAWRLAREVSYPRAVATFKINRFKSQLAVGDVFRLEWREDSAGTVTLYLEITKMEESDTENEDLRITAIEDTTIPPLEGTETGNLYPANNPWDLLPDIQESDLSLFDPTPAHLGEIYPVTALEVPQVMGNLNLLNQGIFVGRKSVPGMVGFNIYWALDAGETYAQLPGGGSFAYTGELLEALPPKLMDVDRSPAGLQFSLTDVNDEAAMLARYNVVGTENDSLENIVENNLYSVVIGEEVFMVGKITKVSTNVYRMTNFIRAWGGGFQGDHKVGDQIFLFTNYPAIVDMTPVPLNQKVKFKLYPIGTGGQVIYGPVRDVTVDATTDRITLAGHGFQQWNGIQFLYGTQPTPLDAANTYYVRDITPNDFKVAASVNGGAINITANGATVRVRAVLASPFYLFQEDPVDLKFFRGETRRPYAAELIGTPFITGSGSTQKWVITMKVRYFDKATAQFPLFGFYDSIADKNLGAISRLVTNGSDITFQATANLGFAGEASETATSVTFTPDEFDDKNAGCFQIQLPRYHANNLSLAVLDYKIFTSKAGFLSKEYLFIDL